MRGNRKIGIYLIATIIVAFITIGFAYLNASLSIVGSSSIKSSSWNVYWDNIQVTDGSVTGEQVTQEPTIDSSKTAVTFNVRLSKPGDFYEFTVDSVNDGTIDAMVSVVSGGAYESNGTTPKELPDYLEYSITYASGDTIMTNDLLKIGWRKKYKVRVYFKEDINSTELPSTPDSFVFKFSASYAQAEIPDVTDTIYWALQDANSDGTNEKLVLSNSQVSGVLNGSFSGNTVFKSYKDVPWITDNYEVSYYVENIVIEGTIAPKSTAHWFYDVGFGAATSLTIDLENLVTSHVTDMCGMFQYTGRYDLDFSIKGISKWDTSSVKDMSSMFKGILVNWSENMSYIPFRIDISEWDTSNVEDMSYMFDAAADSNETFDIDLSKWDTSKVTSMKNMFSHAGQYSYTWNVGDLSEWDTSKVIDMSHMFEKTGYSADIWNIGDISNWKTISVTNTSYMFEEAGREATTFKLDLSNWDTSKVENMSSMFAKAGRGATTWSIGDISGWDTSKVNDMSYMFFLADEFGTTFELDLSNWNTSKVTNMDSMFAHAGQNATTWSIGDISGWKTSKVTNMKEMFYVAAVNSPTFELDLSDWDTSSVEDLSCMFAHAGQNATTWSIGDISGWDTSKVTNMKDMFFDAGSNATSFSLNLSGWDTSNVNDMDRMFFNAGYNATTFNLNLSGWNTSSVTNMQNMFWQSGYNSTTWSITIPQTNGGGISNTTSTLYGSTTSVNALASASKTGRTFTLASS